MPSDSLPPVQIQEYVAAEYTMNSNRGVTELLMYVVMDAE